MIAHDCISGPPQVMFITNTTVADSLQVYWYHNRIQLTTNKADGILVYESDQVTSQVLLVAVFNSVDRSRSGTYTCRALGMWELWWNDFRNNDGVKESRIIPEF